MDQCGSRSMANEGYGVLVGWRHEEVGGRLILKIESVRSLEQSERHDIDTQHLVMSHNQAAVMANYLFHISRQSPPLMPKRGWLSRWFAGGRS